MEQISGLIGQYGFPAFVAIWFMVKSSKDSEKMTQALTELKIVIEKLTEKCKGC
jgi:hypothetical protein